MLLTLSLRQNTTSSCLDVISILPPRDVIPVFLALSVHLVDFWRGAAEISTMFVAVQRIDGVDDS